MLNKIIKKIFHILVVMLVWLSIWELICFFNLTSKSLIPFPHKILSNMMSLEFINRYIVVMLPNTFLWVIIAWSLGILTAILFAIASIASTSISRLLQVVFISGRTLPSVIAIPLFAAIMGFGRPTTFICTIFLVLCYSEPSIQESLRTINTTRKAFLEVVPLSRFNSLILIILPGISKTLKAISTQSFGIALVVTIAGEMILALPDSIGNEVAQMAWLLKMVDLYSLISWLRLSSLITMQITEYLPRFFELPANYTIHKINDKIL